MRLTQRVILHYKRSLTAATIQQRAGQVSIQQGSQDSMDNLQAQMTVTSAEKDTLGQEGSQKTVDNLFEPG